MTTVRTEASEPPSPMATSISTRDPGQLQQELEESREELRQVLLEYKEALKLPTQTNAESSARNKKIKDLDEQRKVLDSLVGILQDQLNAGPQHSASSRDRRSESKAALASKRVAQIKDIPRWNGSGDVEDFISNFRHRVETHALDGYETNLFLRTCIQKEAYGWLERYFPDKTALITVEHVKESMYQQYLTVTWKQKKLYELLLIAYEKWETPRQFSARFLESARRLEKDLTSTAPEDAFLK